VKSIVYGGLDGIVTTFAIVAASAGGGLDLSAILIVGFSNVFADALSMGLGDALSTKSEHEFILKEREREEWEMKNNEQGELDEMVELYEQKGLSTDDAKQIIGLMSKYREFFIDVMMVEELGLQVPDKDENVWYDGFITFCSFVLFGILPLLAYAIGPAAGYTDANGLLGIACGITLLTLFLLGAIKSQFTVQSWYMGGLEIMFFGAFCAAIAYGIGYGIERLVSTPPDIVFKFINTVKDSGLKFTPEQITYMTEALTKLIPTAP
jgi:VIT1/CCC1 family predicted Fe2+/Mn2+ transporter